MDDKNIDTASIYDMEQVCSLAGSGKVAYVTAQIKKSAMDSVGRLETIEEYHYSKGKDGFLSLDSHKKTILKG